MTSRTLAKDWLEFTGRLGPLFSHVRLDASLAEYTTFRLGGPCPCLISCQTPDQLEQLIHLLDKEKQKFILIGGGSNIIVSDRGVDCVVIRYVSDEPQIEQAGTDLIAAAGTGLDALALSAAERGLEGLNYTSGIPGTVGGAVIGNAGAFGRQVGDVLKWVLLISPSGVKRKVGPQELNFQYRSSHLKDSGDFILSAAFSLRQGDRPALLKERQEILSLRAEKHPDLKLDPCAGSIFRNIEPTSKAGRRQAAGWFLDQAGGKTLRHGGAVIYEKHANIIVRRDNCTAQDVYELTGKMAALAKKAFNLDLVREVRFVGRFEGTRFDENKLFW